MAKKTIYKEEDVVIVPMSKRVKDRTGERINNLTVLGFAGIKNKKGYWWCKCKCGNIVQIAGNHLTPTGTKSCGCFHAEKCKDFIVDIKGQKFGKLTALEPTNKRTGTSVVWKCKCDCGNICEVSQANLKNNRTISCGCYNRGKTSQLGLTQGKENKINLLGQKFGKLTVLEDTGKRQQRSIIWKCQCDCGNICEVNGSNLRKGSTLSCGCLKMSRGEFIINNLLKENDISFVQEFSDKDCKLSTGGIARFDFYVDNKYYIEYDGEQHFRYSGLGWNNKENFEKTQQRDKEKNDYCLNNNIPLIRIPFTHLDNLCIDDLKLETSKFIK